MVPLLLTLMVNCFRLPLLPFGVSTNSSPFCLMLYCCQSLVWLRAISINGVLLVASFSQVAVACSTNGLKNHRVLPSETRMLSSGCVMCQLNRLGRFTHRSP